jgi:hypothetical protein
MRTICIAVSILALVVNSSVRADDGLPKRLDFDRYRGMLDHSPFAIATAVVAPAATPSACTDLYIANAARTQEGDTVTLMSTTDRDFKKYLTTKNPVDGYAIAGVEWSDKVGETKVTISKDGQFCTLTFNQSLLSQPQPNRPSAMPGVPAMPIPMPTFQRPPGFPAPAAPATTPHVRGLIPRNPQPQISFPPGVSPFPTPAQKGTTGWRRQPVDAGLAKITRPNHRQQCPECDPDRPNKDRIYRDV